MFKNKDKSNVYKDFCASHWTEILLVSAHVRILVINKTFCMALVPITSKSGDILSIFEWMLA